MKGIFTIIIFLVLGIAVGLVFAKMIHKLYNYLLKKKITKLALEKRKAFSFKDTPYDIKSEIEKQQGQRKKKGLFKKRVKGGESQNGNTIQPRGEGTTETNEGSSQVEHTNQATTEERGSERGTTRTFSRNLSFKARKFN